MSRLNIAPILRGHWKGLSNGIGQDTRPDWQSRAVLLVVPVAVGGLTNPVELEIHTAGGIA